MSQAVELFIFAMQLVLEGTHLLPGYIECTFELDDTLPRHFLQGLSLTDRIVLVFGKLVKRSFKTVHVSSGLFESAFKLHNTLPRDLLARGPEQLRRLRFCARYSLRI
jgi:hypothetical protein